MLWIFHLVSHQPLSTGLPGSGLDISVVPDRDPFCLVLLGWCSLFAATCLWRRLVVPYQQFPWRLAALADSRLQPHEHDTVARQFLQSHPCCLDQSFSMRFKSVLQSAEQLKQGGRYHGVIQVLSHNKVINAEVECNFARANAQKRSAAGTVWKQPPCSSLSWVIVIVVRH